MDRFEVGVSLKQNTGSTGIESERQKVYLQNKQRKWGKCVFSFLKRCEIGGFQSRCTTPDIYIGNMSYSFPTYVRCHTIKNL